MKSEVDEKHIEEVIALQAKSYSLKFAGGGISRLKGVPCGRQKVSHENYRASLSQNCKRKRVYFSIRNYKDEVITGNTRKSFLSAYDDKRYTLSSGRSFCLWSS